MYGTQLGLRGSRLEGSGADKGGNHGVPEADLCLYHLYSFPLAAMPLPHTLWELSWAGLV